MSRTDVIENGYCTMIMGVSNGYIGNRMRREIDGNVWGRWKEREWGKYCGFVLREMCYEYAECSRTGVSKLCCLRAILAYLARK